MNNMLDAREIASLLPDGLAGIDIRVFQTIDSTNNYAKRLILDGAAPGTAILAESQTAGRGRRGRSFYSPAGSGLYISVILRPKIDAVDDIQLLTAAAAVAVCLAIDRLKPDSGAQIKWVNDIFIGGKKVCGILSEAVSAGYRIAGTVVGIGVNCTTDAFPPELRDIACSLGGDISRNALAAGIIAELLPLAEKLRSPELIAKYRRRSYTLGRRIAFERGGRTVFATADSINDNGNLVVREPDGTLTVLFSGEATLA